MSETYADTPEGRAEFYRMWDAATPKRAPTSHRASIMPLAEAVRLALRKRDREIAALRADIAGLRNELAVARRLDDIMARLEKIENAPRSSGGLRAV